MAARNRVPLIVAVIVGIIAVVAVRAATSPSSPSSDSGAKAGGDVPKGCTTLNVAASSEKAALLQAIADDYAKDDGQADGKCARVIVRTKASGGATTALASGWDEKVDGPRPDVWTPASTSWTALLRYQTTSRDLPDLVGDAKPPSIARTPLTIAMPKPMAQVLGWPTKPIGWSDILALAKDPQGWGRYGKP
ncbi:MAG: Ca-activated chloride channel, partial [Actinomycetota bacterium]|nr:Ca-activated chloride channel [Actinomycetota bacterium]